ncbi:MAG: 16S rRNA (adenine(1518)-N(6)/adenine(1519)-N(6))-dimethyltransferase RsmA [Gammaproteobacteria bacterium]|jgi:16S rRNA (adenine1518-N6/adenine1519-N6)-dimethyltransferase
MKVRARKRFGQHFLHDSDVINRIIDHVEPGSDTTWIEIGPGRGALTFPLLERIKCLHVVEIDKDLSDLLESNKLPDNKLIIHREDAMKLDFCARFPGQLSILGNLPYNISTPILFHLLNHSKCIRQMLFMLQKEVADRICADAGSKTYGRLSVMVQSVCETQKLFDVSPGSFTPQPKVESTVLKLSPEINKYPKILKPDIFKLIVRSAFSKRRKTIRNALKGIIGEELLLSVAIDPSSRPETISVESFITLANKLAEDQ